MRSYALGLVRALNECVKLVQLEIEQKKVHQMSYGYKLDTIKKMHITV